jgi:hypothetical protein
MVIGGSVLSCFVVYIISQNTSKVKGFSLPSHNALGASLCSFFATRQKTNQKSAVRGKPLTTRAASGARQAASVAPLRFAKARLEIFVQQNFRVRGLKKAAHTLGGAAAVVFERSLRENAKFLLRETFEARLCGARA